MKKVTSRDPHMYTGEDRVGERVECTREDRVGVRVGAEWKKRV